MMQDRGRALVVWTAALLVACSSPTKHVDEPPPAAQGDANATVAAVPTDAALEDAAVAVDAPQVETFAWKEARDWYTAFKKTPVGSKSPCDFRLPAIKRPRNVECLPPGGPLSQAATVRQTRPPTDPEHCKVQLDLGSNDAISLEWVAALVDEQERVVSTWVPITEVSPHYSEVRFDLGCNKVHYLAHIALKRNL